MRPEILSGIHKTMANNNHNGFTLVEIAIALIIIGLVIGGIFVGQAMIKSSELNKVMTDVNKYIAAVNTFKLKYDCLPGDCDNATIFFPSTTNGDGNGYIDNIYVNPEESFAWEQLGLASLINGSYIGTVTPENYWTLGESFQAGYNVPHTSINESSFFRIVYEGNITDFYNHFFYKRDLGHVIYANDICRPSFALCTDDLLTPSQAYYLDSKYDDGDGWMGNIVSTAADGDGSCVDDPAYSTDGSYHLTNKSITCIPVFLTGF